MADLSGIYQKSTNQISH